MTKSKALYSILFVQVHTTALSFLFSETKSKYKKSCILQRTEESNPVFTVDYFFLETSVNWVVIDQLFGDFLS
jgi:hypothetical protein